MQASETQATVWDDSWEGSWLGHSFIHPWFIYSFINFSFRKHLMITYCDPVIEQGAGKELWDTALTPQSSGKGKQSKQAIRVQYDGGYPPWGWVLGAVQTKKKKNMDPARSQRRFTWVGDRRWRSTNQLKEKDTSGRRSGISNSLWCTPGSSMFQWVLNSSVPKISLGVKSFATERLSEGINFWNKWSTSIND